MKTDSDDGEDNEKQNYTHGSMTEDEMEKRIKKIQELIEETVGYHGITLII